MLVLSTLSLSYSEPSLDSSGNQQALSQTQSHGFPSGVSRDGQVFSVSGQNKCNRCGLQTVSVASRLFPYFAPAVWLMLVACT